MAASPTRAALMPASAGQLNVKPAEAGSTKKRKRPEEYDTSIFTARTASSRQKPETCTFTSITTIARRNLPLAWLSPLRSQAQIPPGYVFRTSTILLHQNHENVLISRLCPNGGLYAIDNATQLAYTAWPLTNWVSEELCHKAAQGTFVLPEIEQLQHDTGDHSRTASISSDIPAQLPTPRSPKQAKNRRGAMARMSILTSKDLPEPITSVDEPIFPQHSIGSPQVAPEEFAPDTQPVVTPTAPEDAMRSLTESLQGHQPAELNLEPTAYSTSSRGSELTGEQIVQQYLETLYLSRASLAFWVKGPLSRARAQARRQEVDFSLEALKEAYLSMVLPTKKLDLKYKESISTTVRELPLKEPANTDATKRNGRRYTKIAKLRRDCLYSGEDERIVNWWKTRELHENDLGKATSDLRSRETAMQLLLILEVLYLDILLSKEAEKTTGSPGPEIKTESVEEDSTVLHAKPTRAKRKRDLNGELDANAERLSIWHTVALEEILSSPEKARETSESSTIQSKDKLRDFCRDVIIPFYSAKLPEQAKSICRKLGGPQISPQRPRAPSSTSTKRPASSAGTKTAPPALKRSLQRVLSEDQTARHASPPVLSRSSTVAHVPKLKREASESDIRPLSRSGMQKSVSFSNREIDLVGEAKAHETRKRKLDKLATQKKELEEAIDALKKPNRTSAAKTFMDEVERRSIDPKTSTKRVDNQIHITATPRRAKSKSVSAAADDQAQSQIPAVAVAEAAVVPSSTFKPAHNQIGLGVPLSSKKKRAVLSAIHDTPSRGSSKVSDRLPIIEATPANNRLRPDLPTDTPVPTWVKTKAGGPVLFTPIKRKDLNAEDSFLFRDVPEIPEKAGKAMDRVMGSKGMEESFSLDFAFHDTPSQALDTADVIAAVTGIGDQSPAMSGAKLAGSEPARPGEDEDIYKQLGWDDCDDI